MQFEKDLQRIKNGTSRNKQLRLEVEGAELSTRA